MKDEARAVGLRCHVKTRKKQSANDNVGNPDWLNDASIESFMASIPAESELVASV